MGEKVIAMVKPWGFFFWEQILGELGDVAKIKDVGVIPHVSPRELWMLYERFKEEGYYKHMHRDLVGKPMAAIGMEGDNAVELVSGVKNSLRERLNPLIAQNHIPRYERNVLDSSKSPYDYKKDWPPMMEYFYRCRDMSSEEILGEVKNGQEYMIRFYRGDLADLSKLVIL